MADQRRNRILLSFEKLMSGVVRLALRNGVTYKEFIQVCRSLYVSICSREYGIQGRATNVSRIALMTGLDRKEVRKVLDSQQQSASEPGMAPDRVSRILSAWHQDPEYIDDEQQPIALPVEGPAPSFEQLVKAFGGDMPAVTILRELKRSKIIEEGSDGLLLVKKPYYIPNYCSGTDETPELTNPDAIEHGSSMLVDHINTIFYNLYRNNKSLRERIELRATHQQVAKSKVDDFYKLIDEKAMALLHEVDDWLETNQVQDSNEESERLGIGVYFIQGANQNITLEDHQDST